MAARYWVPGGTGATNSTTNWSTTSGGSSGASVPGASDDAIFDANSGSGTATFSTATWLSVNFTGFTGTFAGTGVLTIAGGNVTFGSGMTITWSGNLQFNVAGSTITANGKSITGLMLITSGFAPGGSITLSGNFQCGGFQHSSVSGTVNINGGDLRLAQTSGTLISTSSGRFIAGTSKIVLAGTGTINTAGISNNVDVNTSGTITQTSNVTITGGTWTYVAGTWVHANNGFSIGGSCTLNLAGMTIGRLLTGAAATCTLTSHLTIALDVQYSLASGFIFAGTHGFTCATLTDNATSTARAITLAAGIEYFVTSSLYLQSGWTGGRPSIVSGSPGTRAKLTLSNGCSLFLPNCTLTDIDAGNGITIWNYSGTVSNCINVKTLPSKLSTIGTVN